MTSAQNEDHRVNLLLVDDRPNNLISLKAVLERPDYNVVLARSGPEALNCVLREDFAVILLDVAMPGMDGFETASTIKEREQSKLIPIIFITADVYDMEHIFRGYTVGAVDYLRKPVDPCALRAKVAVFVELYRQRKQIELQAFRIREAEVREQRLLRERAEQALHESETIYQMTFEHAPVAIGHASPEGTLSRVNKRLSEILGHSREELIGRSFELSADDRGAHAFADALDELRIGERDFYSGEHLLNSPSGTSVWANITVSALRDSSDKTTRLVIVVDDISEKKEVELERARLVRELTAGVRARDDFLSIAAHELKTPLTPLRLQTKGLLREIEKRGDAVLTSERVSRRLKTIDKAADRLEQLVHRLLDLSRVNVGKLMLEPEDVDLSLLVHEVIRRLPEDGDREASAIVIRADEPVVGCWDPFRLEQVILNLVGNALKYGEGKPIEVSVSTDENIATVRVRDHGIGIAEDVQHRLFERFERVAPTQHYGGFGLGLWIVRQIVEAHGGRIQLWSRPGEGSEFTVELPCHMARKPAPGGRTEAAEMHP